MILTGRILPLLIPILIQHLIDLYLSLTHSQNPIRAIILMNSWLKYLVDLLILLMLIRLLVLILIQEELKPTFLIILVALSPTSLIISCSSVTFISVLIQYNLIWTLQKSTMQWPISLEQPRTGFVMEHWNTNNFYFSDFIFIFLLFFFWTMKKAHDTAVT